MDVKEITAVNNRVLDVDLTSGEISVIQVSEEDRRLYLGGKGLALKLVFDRIKPEVDPLGPENLLAVMSGPAAGTPAPAGGRFCVVSKSPLTGIFASSFVGGRFGLSLKKAGFDGILVRGKAPKPVMICVDDGEAVIEEAGENWGMDTYEFQEKNKARGDWLAAGPAGENLVRYAVLLSGRRVAGRCGMGAVMGSKNLKGISAKGSAKIRPADPVLFKKAVQVAQKKVKAHEITGKRLRELGTPQNVNTYGTTAIMPVRNYSRASFEKREEICAETLRDRHFLKNHGCVGCPIQCSRTGNFNGQELVSPEYETICLMGSNLLIGDLVKIAGFNDRLNRLGMDTISCGNTLGFAMELTEKGLLDSGLSFGDAEAVDAILDDIAFRRGLGNDLAEGVRSMARKYGGEDFAIHVKGLEMAAYDPRGCVGQGLGYATANAGASHLSGSTHAVEVESYLNAHDNKGKAEFVQFMQDLTDAVNSAIFCIQTEYPFLEQNPIYQYTPKPVLSFFMQTFPGLAVGTTDLSDYCNLLAGLFGRKIKRRQFYEIGERIFNLERLMNVREGVSKKDDTLPKRILNEVREDNAPPIQLEVMLAKYYRLRGWDKEGKPGKKVLKRLGIQA